MSNEIQTIDNERRHLINIDNELRHLALDVLETTNLKHILYIQLTIVFFSFAVLCVSAALQF